MNVIVECIRFNQIYVHLKLIKILFKDKKKTFLESKKIIYFKDHTRSNRCILFRHKIVTKMLLNVCYI